MKFTLQNTEDEKTTDYYVDENIIFQYIKDKMSILLSDNTRTLGATGINLSRNSLTSVALRQVATLFVLPLLEWLCKQNDIESPKKEKHGDIMKHCVTTYFMVMDKILSETHITVRDAPYVDEIRTFDHIAIEKEETDNPLLFH